MEKLEKLPNWARYLLAIIAFWIIIFIGPFILVLWNELSFYKAEEGTLTFLIFSIVAQPISCWVACITAYKLSPNKNSIPVIVNSTIAGVILAINLLQAFFYHYSWEYIVCYFISIVTLTVSCIKSYKDEHIKP